MRHLQRAMKNVWLVISLIQFGLLLTSCGNPPPTISDPEVVEPSSPIGLGAEVSLKIEVTSSVPVSYRWESDGRGDEIISGETSSAIVWQAPQKPGLYNVRVKVTINGNVTEKSVAIKVLKIIDLSATPTAIETSVPTYTLTPATIPLLTITPNLTPTVVLSTTPTATAIMSLTPQPPISTDTLIVGANVISTPVPTTPSPLPTTTLVPPTNTPLPPTVTPLPPPPPSDTPTATSTPAPTSTSTPTDTPVPVDCGPPTNRGCLMFIAPQLAEISSANPFVFTDQPLHCRVEYTSENVHSEPVALKIVFEANSPNYCGWGIGQLPSYDVSGFHQVSFYLKGTAIGQTFEFKMKDINLVEDTKLVTVNSDQWTEVTFALTKDNFPNVDFTKLENINLGFNDSYGNATIYVDDFTIK